MTPQDMSYCQLVGWLEICEFRQQELEGQAEPVSVVEGYIYTDKEYYGGKHPAVFKGQQAEIILAAARKNPTTKLRIFTHGSLRSGNGCTRVLVKFVRIIEQGVNLIQISDEITALFEKQPNGNPHKEIIAILAKHMAKK
ncbi:MAG: hypothetical protein H8D34_14055 [Chloroflexi bacterium]|nr:hypothetical protein [Chloroflexota bacterium]